MLISRSLRTIVGAAAILAFPVAAEVIDIRWAPSGEFDRVLSLAPDRIAEVCGKLVKGSLVDWRFSGSAPLDFNIHYHAGKDVVHPAKADAVAALSGVLSVDTDQDYCWMWRNKAGAPVSLRLTLRHRK